MVNGIVNAAIATEESAAESDTTVNEIVPIDKL